MAMLAMPRASERRWRVATCFKSCSLLWPRPGNVTQTGFSTVSTAATPDQGRCAAGSGSIAQVARVGTINRIERYAESLDCYRNVTVAPRSGLRLPLGARAPSASTAEGHMPGPHRFRADRTRPQAVRSGTRSQLPRAHVRTGDIERIGGN